MSHHSIRHLNIKARSHRFHTIAQSKDPVRNNKSIKVPFVSQDARQQCFVVPAKIAIDRVVCTHYARHTFINDALKVRQIDFVQCSFINRYINTKTGVFHAVKCKMFHGRHHMSLCTTCERSTHLAYMVRIFTVCLLSSSPRWVPKKIDTNTSI